MSKENPRNEEVSEAFKALYREVIRQTYVELYGEVAKVPKHQRWFNGDPVVELSGSALEREISSRFAKEITSRLFNAGGANYDEFASKMRGLRHQMRRSVVARLLPRSITHGTCRFGEVIEGIDADNLVNVVRFFVTNGDVQIVPFRDEMILKLKDRSKERAMWYGLAQRFDRCGNLIDMRRDRGDNGILFLTDDKREAFFNVAALSTGMSVDAVREMAEKPKPRIEQAPAFSPV